MGGSHIWKSSGSRRGNYAVSLLLQSSVVFAATVNAYECACILSAGCVVGFESAESLIEKATSSSSPSICELGRTISKGLHFANESENNKNTENFIWQMGQMLLDLRDLLSLHTEGMEEADIAELANDYVAQIPNLIPAGEQEIPLGASEVVVSKPRLPIEISSTKLFTRVRNQLKSSGTVPDYSDIAKLLRLLGFKQVRKKGSHEQWLNDNVTFTVVNDGRRLGMSTVVHMRELLRQYADY